MHVPKHGHGRWIAFVIVVVCIVALLFERMVWVGCLKEWGLHLANGGRVLIPKSLGTCLFQVKSSYARITTNATIAPIVDYLVANTA